jgi:Ca2+-binding EF-hand superfamily protein
MFGRPDVRKFCYYIFDKDKNGYIEQDELTALIDLLHVDDLEINCKSALTKFDTNGDNAIDCEEFQHLLTFLGHRNSSKEKAMNLLETILEHSSSGNVNRNNKNNNDKELSRDQFLNAVTNGEIEGLTHSGNKWVEVVERERVFTSYLAGVLLVFFRLETTLFQLFDLILRLPFFISFI